MTAADRELLPDPDPTLINPACDKNFGDCSRDENQDNN
jgi:hypothetical protein